MNDERLWAPWRIEYVAGGDSKASVPQPTEWCAGADQSCFLCRAAGTFADPPSADRELLVAERADKTILVLNRFPYNNGHVLISPRRHVAEIGKLSSEEHLECMALMSKLTGVYREHLNADGFNIGLNLGRVAGAGVPGHLHWHLVPRWAGDNNFMPVLAGTRVIPQSLAALWEMLREVLKK